MRIEKVHSLGENLRRVLRKAMVNISAESPAVPGRGEKTAGTRPGEGSLSGPGQAFDKKRKKSEWRKDPVLPLPR